MIYDNVMVASIIYIPSFLVLVALFGSDENCCPDEVQNLPVKSAGILSNHRTFKGPIFFFFSFFGRNQMFYLK